MDYTSNLLGLQGVSIDNYSENENFICIDISTSPKYPSCKYCRWNKTHILGYRYQLIKDIPIHSKPVMLRLRKRRYICPSCGKSFFESYDFLPRYHHLTNRLFASVLLEFKSSDSFKKIASKFSVSYNTVSRCLKLLPTSHPHDLPDVIGIDEFKGNASGEKYQCILTDIKNKTVFDVLPNRNKSYLINYFRQFKNRDKVKYFVMDMTNNYKSIAWLFPNAEVVADRFHYVRQVYWALNTVRKEEQKNFPKYKRKYFKHSRKLLFCKYDSLSEENKQAVRIMLSQSEKLHKAWDLKESFIDFRKAKTRETAEKELLCWILQAEESELSEFTASVTAFHRWSKSIINSVVCGYSNGFTEGINNKIKVLKRNAYGFHNFATFRKRILFSTAKITRQTAV